MWTDLSVGGGGCKRCWCFDSEPQPLAWAPDSEAQTGSGWGWWDESDSGPGRVGCVEMASGFSLSGSRWCCCACLWTRKQMCEGWMSLLLERVIYIQHCLIFGFFNCNSTFCISNSNKQRFLCYSCNHTACPSYWSAFKSAALHLLNHAVQYTQCDSEPSLHHQDSFVFIFIPVEIIFPMREVTLRLLTAKILQWWIKKVSTSNKCAALKGRHTLQLQTYLLIKQTLSFLLNGKITVWPLGRNSLSDLPELLSCIDNSLCPFRGATLCRLYNNLRSFRTLILRESVNDASLWAQGSR